MNYPSATELAAAEERIARLIDRAMMTDRWPFGKCQAVAAPDRGLFMQRLMRGGQPQKRQPAFPNIFGNSRFG